MDHHPIPAPQPFLKALMSLTFIISVHLVTFAFIVTTATIDPSELILRLQKSSGILPQFHQAQHLHVIENLFCNICEIKV
ncbi:putative palmitoyltransferase ZDHHC1 [Echinococcus granulosus]|uniref:Palmitoyltransferase zdhhc1 n=1 Tax=Echinococcus granulosus TaxID=6210 RepID=A0A068WI63_ECHGR|nr:putative palmitoyltransferase ZDHHC1 [Echinococcus granulosus]CDS17365.1 palmitoyltransferase zdhhc1 [Echinococcus granulosus]